MRPKVILNLLFFLFCCTAVQAQAGRQITGKVIDAMGELPGVSVVIKGTTNGTTTDLNGEFKLDNVKNGDVLQFSFIGYKTENVKVGNQSKFDITMTENTQTLEEVTVVAVGYGDVRRRDLTGSIGSANMGDLTKTPVSNITESLGGRIAGVQVSSGDGGPGDNFNIVIRGAGSLTGSTAPLYVIDGFPSESSGLGSINPNDIESIDILKDASATAIYGARGANGVVIVTTKKGGAGKPTITYNGSVKVGLVKNTPEVMNAYDFVMLQQEIMGSGEEFQKNYITELYPTLDAYHNAKSYDWQDYIYRTALSHNHHISMTGSQGDLKYTTSLSYDDTQGVIINSGVKRYQGRVNLSQKVNNKLKIDFTGNYASTVQDGPTVSSATSSMSTAYMYSVWSFRPVSPTGSDLLNQMYDEGVNMSEDYRFNPVKSAQNEYRHKTTNNLQFNVGAEYEIIKKLKLKVTAGYTSTDYKNEEFNGSQTRTGNSHPSNTQSIGNLQKCTKSTGNGYGYGFYAATLILWDLFDKNDKRRDLSIAPYWYDVNDNKKTWTNKQIVQRSCGKFRREWESSSMKDKSYTPENYPILRYGDVLLMLAEAENEAHQGPTDLAYECINEIRQRAGISKLEGLSYTDFQQAVRDERARELCFESLRKYDLVRWGIYVEAIHDKLGAATQDKRWATGNQFIGARDYAARTQEKHQFLPIPTKELDVNGKLEQNKYWQ